MMGKLTSLAPEEGVMAESQLQRLAHYKWSVWLTHPQGQGHGRISDAETGSLRTVNSGSLAPEDGAESQMQTLAHYERSVWVKLISGVTDKYTHFSLFSRCCFSPYKYGNLFLSKLSFPRTKPSQCSCST